jgi:hypothetical protein
MTYWNKLLREIDAARFPERRRPMRKLTNELFWKSAPYMASLSIIYGACEYAVTYGAWRATILSASVVAVGFLAAEILYPLWFGHRR